MGPRLDIVNPLLWEIGHLAWFHEHFVLRRIDKADPILPQTDKLYNSMKVHHDTRWDLDLPDLHGTFKYMRAVEDAMIDRLKDGEANEEESYLYQLTTFHEDMHDEAFTFTRQTHSYPAPEFRAAKGQSAPDVGALPGDADVAGGQIELGSRADGPFIFDNEKFGHVVEIVPFQIARTPVTNAAFRTSSKTAAIPTSVTGATRAGAGVKKLRRCIPSIGDAATTATGGCVISTRELRCRQIIRLVT